MERVPFYYVIFMPSDFFPDLRYWLNLACSCLQQNTQWYWVNSPINCLSLVHIFSFHCGSCKRISSPPALAAEDEHQAARGHLNQKLLAECWGYGIENIRWLGDSECLWHCSRKWPAPQRDECSLPQGEGRGQEQARGRPQKVRGETPALEG